MVLSSDFKARFTGYCTIEDIKDTLDYTPIINENENSYYYGAEYDLNDGPFQLHIKFIVDDTVTDFEFFEDQFKKNYELLYKNFIEYQSKQSSVSKSPPLLLTSVTIHADITTYAEKKGILYMRILVLFRGVSDSDIHQYSTKFFYMQLAEAEYTPMATAEYSDGQELPSGTPFAQVHQVGVGKRRIKRRKGTRRKRKMNRKTKHKYNSRSRSMSRSRGRVKR